MPEIKLSPEDREALYAKGILTRPEPIPPTEEPVLPSTEQDQSINSEEQDSDNGDHEDDRNRFDDYDDRRDYKRPSRFARATKVGTLAMAGFIATGSAAGAVHGYVEDGDRSSVIDGLFLPFAEGARLIDRITGDTTSPQKEFSALSLNEDETNTSKPSPTAKPSSTPTQKPSSVASASPTKSNNRTPELCIDDMPVRYKAGQNIAITVDSHGSYATNESSSIPETFDKVRQYDIGNFVVLGTPSKDDVETIRKFADGKILNDPATVIIDPKGININHRLGNDIEPAVAQKELTGKALQDYYKNLKAMGINAAFVRVEDAVVPTSKNASPTPTPTTSTTPKDSLTAITEHIDAAKKSDIQPIVVYSPSAEKMSEAGEKTKKLFNTALLRSTQLITGPTPLPAQTAQQNDAVPEAFNKDVYTSLRKQYGINTFITDDLGAAVDKDGKPIPLVESVVDILARGGIPMFATDANNAKKPLSLDVRLKSIVNSIDDAVKSGKLSEKTLNSAQKTRMETQGRLDQACAIADRENKELANQ